MMKSGLENSKNIDEILSINDLVPAYKRAKVWGIAAIIATFIIVVVMLLYPKGNVSLQYKTDHVQQGTLIVTVTATGELKPVNEVDVGTEVSGTIKTVAVDYNDLVKAGQILAKLNTDKLEAQIMKYQAELESSHAKLLEAQANTVEKRNELKRLKNLREISGGKVPSHHDLDTAEAALKRTLASEAAAKAQISESQATLKTYKTDLAKAIIRSPVDGIVLDRKVEPGQTVAASLQTPVLFTLAEDLKKMELQVDVDEADVGKVKKGQNATFSVDAYPGRKFPTRVTEVRYAPKTNEGVVTYKTLLSVDNSDLSLRPGMTATADIIVKTVKNALLIPNAALRFAPPEKEEQAPKGNGGLVASLLPRPPERSTSEKHQNTSTDTSKQHVWTLQDDIPVAVSVTLGESDGSMTEVTAGDISPGLPLLVDFVSLQKWPPTF